VGTVVDAEQGRDRIIITPDDSPNDRVIIDTDAVSTTYYGSGGTINGAPEIFVGSVGFANVRSGDRIEARGTGSGNGVLRPDRITLLGRPVPAEQVGIGQTRPPTSVSTPTAGGSTPSTAPDRLGRVEGVVRQVNADEGRVVIETDRREILTVRGTSSTPVSYRGNTYRISNLEPGDRIRVQPESTVATGSEISARSIEVTRSAQEGGGTTSRQIGALTGRVTRVERTSETVVVDTDRGSVRVDLTHATDPTGRQIRARDIQAGDQLSMSGNYSGDVFTATTVRFSDEGTTPPASVGGARGGDELGLVTIYATVDKTLANSPQLILRDTQSNNRTIRLYVSDDFVVRTKNGGYTTADRLRENDAVVVKAYRDADGNNIAQTIRMR